MSRLYSKRKRYDLLNKLNNEIFKCLICSEYIWANRNEFNLFFILIYSRFNNLKETVNWESSKYYVIFRKKNHRL